jgi:subtilase family serine protease
MRAGFFVVMACAALGSTTALADPVGSGVTYLRSSQGPDGSYGTAEEPATATAEVLTAFSSLHISDASMEQAQLFLATLPPQTDSEIELRRRLVLSGSMFGASVTPLVSEGAGFDASDVLHLAWTLRLANAGGGSPQDAVTWATSLAQLARSTGCYGFADNDDSVELTADALISLQPLGFLSSVGAAQSAGASCLLSNELPDGDFGSSVATAEAILALEAHPEAAAQVQLARQWLIATQLPDGSWDESVRATALAVRALSESGPDWRVATNASGLPLLVLADPEPIQGAIVAASLDVQNVSITDAPPSVVRFSARPVNGGAEVVVLEAALVSIPAGQVAHVSVQLPTAALAGRYTLRAVVDPDNQVPELSELNNEADAPLNVRQENDLAVTTQSIRFVDAGNGQVTIQVAVKNLGVPLPQDVRVDVYKGTQTAGVKLGSATVPAGLGLNASATVSVAWNASSANGPTVITAVVDPENLLNEANEGNNQAFRYYYPGSGKPVDLAVSRNTAQFPAQPIANQQFVVSIPVVNLSANDATEVAVAVRDNNSGATYGSITLPMIAANSTVTASIPLSLSAQANLAVAVDPSNQLNDTNRFNNTVFVGTVTPTTAPDYDFTLSNLTGLVPSVGQTVTLTASVSNAGSKSAQPVITVVDETTGTVVNSSVVALAAGQGKTVAVATFAMPATTPMLKACIDADQQYQEQNENDNCAEWVGTSGSTDLSLHGRDITVSPIGPDVGEVVHVSALVRNHQAVKSSAVVEWWQGRPTGLEGIFLGQTPISVPASGTATAQFDFVRRPGPVEVYGRLVEVTPKDTATQNNVGGRHLFLQSIIDIGQASYESSELPEIRFARLTGHAAPELILGYRFSSFVAGNREGMAVLQPRPDGSYQQLWSVQRLPYVQNIEIADLDGDGQPEIVLETSTFGQSGVTGSVEFSVFEPDGTVKWEKTFSSYDASCTDTNGAENLPNNFTLGDVDNDGVADVVFRDQNIQAFSGRDGTTLWTTPLTTPLECNYDTVAVLDAFGDGKREVLFTSQFRVSLARAEDGHILWTTTPTSGYGSTAYGAIVDVDGDGAPDLVLSTYRRGLTVVDVQTGQVKTTGAESFDDWPLSLAIGDVRQNGLPDYLLANDGYSNWSAAYSTDFQQLWLQEFPFGPNSDTGFSTGDVFVGTLADLYGRGRPQYIQTASSEPLVVQDGRTGEVLLPTTPNETMYPFGQLTPVIADTYGTGHGTVAVGSRDTGDIPSWNVSQIPEYWPGQVFLFGSAHWQKMPTVWNARQYRRSQVDENLKLSNDYRWWTHDNTWNDQYVDTPSRLLADLAILPGDVTTASAYGVAGQPLTISAVVRNRGGLPASNVKVSLYDGDPSAGGKWLLDTVVPGPLPARTGVATATFSWTAYPEGEHTLYAVANSDFTIEEPGQEDNTSSVHLFVQPGTQLCDLALVAGSLSAAPADVQAGATLTLTATVTNNGPVGCAASTLAVYDGPEGNASTFGTASTPALDPGASATVTISADAVPGSHLFRFVADDGQVAQDGDRTNNQGVLQFYVSPSDKPDLLWDVAAVSPSPAIAGQSVQLSGVVRNQGAVSAATTFSVLVAGNVIATGQVPSLLAGATANVQATITAPSTTSDIQLVLDPANAVDEFNEANNSTTLTLPITPPVVALSGSVTPSSVSASTNAAVSVSVSNVSGAGQEVFVTASVLDASGKSLTTLLDAVRVLTSAGSNQTLSTSWNTGTSPVGSYRVHVIATQGGQTVASLDLPFSIVGNGVASTALLADRKDYAPGEQVLLTQRLSNVSPNAVLSGTSVTVNVSDTHGEQLSSSVRPAPDLPAGGVFDTTDLFKISSGLSPGKYIATSRVTDVSGLLIAQSTTTFAVSYPPASLVSATVTVQSPFGVGQPLPVDVLLTNRGSEDESGGTLSVTLVDTASSVEEAQAATTVSVAAQTSASTTVTLGAVGTAGQKLLVVMLDGVVVDRELIEASVYVDHTPPNILVSGVNDQELTNSDVTPVVTIQDESQFTSSLQLDGQPFQSGTAVSAEGDHLLIVSAQDGYGNQSQVSVRFTIDKTPPVLSLTGPSDGSILNTPVSLEYSATDDHPGLTSSTVDSASIEAGSVITSEGDHVWVVTSTDARGNTATQTVHFTLDFTPPAVAIGGITDGELTNQSVTPTVQVADAHLGTVQITLDGAPYTTGTAVTAEGQHTLSVTASDLAGNTTVQSIQFELDLTPPLIQFGGVADGALVNHLVTPTFGATDAHLDSVSATLDGQPFSSGSTVASEGTHVLTVHATDTAGNASDATLTFTLDLTPPVISVAGVQDGQLTNQPVVPTFSATDLHLQAVSATLDGAAFASGTQVSAEGDHSLAVTATDAAGNSSQKPVAFTIDTTPPVITIAGVTDGGLYNHSVTPTSTASDLHPGTVTATLDGQPFSLGTPVSAEGTHVLSVHAVDAAGNGSDSRLSFTLDLTPPAIHVSGVTNSAFYSASVSATFSETDAHPGSVSATLDGQPYVSGTPISAEDSHTLSVHATDLAGNASNLSVSFVIDLTPPSIALSGVVDGAFYNHAVDPSYSASDTYLASVGATLDGAVFASGGTVSSEGVHQLVVTAADRAGNQAQVQASFELDLTAPVVSVSGVAEGQYYATAPTVTYTATDRNLLSVTATLDGAALASGTAVSIEGAHVLIVSATDKAGNQANTTIHFTTDFTPPVISVAGVSEGQKATSFTATFSATDANLDSVSATLNGAAFTSGTTVTSLGANTLVVTATDKAGNHATQTVHFVVVPSRPSFSFAACALSSMLIENSANVAGLGTSSGSIGSDGSVSIVGPAAVTGDAVVGGNVSLSNSSSISGTAYHGGTLSLANSSSVGGNVTSSPAPTPCACGYDATAEVATAQTYNDNALLTSNSSIAPYLQNGALVMSGGTITLPSGNFYLTGLSLSSSAQVSVASGGNATLFVDGNVSVQNKSVLGTNSQNARTLVVVSTADSANGGSVTLLNNASSAFQLWAPKADLTVSNHAYLYGAVVAKSVTLENNQTLLFSPGPQASPPPLTCQ